VLTAFGAGFFYRVVLPGIVAVTLMAPVRPNGMLTRLNVSGLADRTAIFFLVVFAAGLVLSSARHVIYYAAEGFYWVPWEFSLRRRLVARVKHKRAELATLNQKRAAGNRLSQREELRALHLNEFLADFPLSTRGGRPRYVVDRPTRIGNVIAAYELYAGDRYGFDGVFYWYHLRFSTPDSVQTELDRAESIADGMVFCTAAAFAATLVYGLIVIGRVMGAAAVWFGYSRLLPSPSASDGVIALGLAASVVAWLGFNRLSLFALRTFGKEMRAVTDLYAPAVVKLAEPWLPGPSHTSALQTRKSYLKDGTPLPRQPPKTQTPAPPPDPATPRAG
jgi:hypothetical protein